MTTSTGAHLLRLNETAHETPQGYETTFQAACSCRWEGTEFSTDIRRDTFHSSLADECETAAVEQGDEHRAGQS